MSNKMLKIVINNSFGGFEISKAVYLEMNLLWKKHGYLKNEDFGVSSINEHAYRAHPKLISAIEKIGVQRSSGIFSELKIIEIPADVEWGIDEYDGIETVHEKHRSWG